jgi:hypothetical protein
VWKAKALRHVDRRPILCLLMFLSRPSFEVILAADNKQQWQLLNIHGSYPTRVKTGGCCFVVS